MRILNTVRPRICMHSALLSLFIIMTLAGCTGGADSDVGDDGVTGRVSFQLAWNGAQPPETDNNPVFLVSGDVCTDYNIQWIYAQAVDQSGKEQDSRRWPCIHRQGQLSDLPVGTYHVFVQGEVSGEITWQGEVTGVQVIDNQTADAGRINMVHIHDHEPPVVVKTVPADGSQEMPVNSALTATFDDAIVAQSIGTENFILTYRDKDGSEIGVECTLQYDSKNHVAVLTPNADLITDTAYTATIAVDRGLIVEDMAGNPMQEDEQWTFTTFRPDIEAPYIQSRNPENFEMDVALSPDVQIRFSEPVNTQTINENNILLQHNGSVIQCDLTYDDQLNMVTLKPVDDLRVGSTFTVSVTSEVADLAGNTMSGDDSWSFVTQFPDWHLETVDGVQASWATAIAVDSNDRPYISFQDMLLKKLKYVNRVSAGEWATRPLDNSEGSGEYQDIVIGKYDTLHLGYFDTSQSRLVYYSEGLENGAAYAVIVDSTIDCQGVSVAADETNHGHICYYDAETSEFRYAAYASGWKVEIIDTGGGQYPAIAVEPEGQPHVSYFDVTNGHLKYATKASGRGWITETVDPGVNIGSDTSIALDTSGTPHISYHDQDNGALKYAAKQPSGDWLIETADNEGQVGGDTGIALDSYGLPHISYLDSSNTALKYATRTAIGSWHTQIVDNSGTVGSGTSIVVDSQDYIHISHCNFILGGQLNYATTRPQN